MVETSGSRRKPFSDRNAPIPSQLNVSSNKAAAMVSRPGTSAVNPSTRPRRQAARPAKESKLAGLSTTPAPASQRARSPKTAMPRQFSHVEILVISSSPADSLSAQIEAAEHHSKNKMAAPSHAELIRISPDIDSDDLEYFDVSTLQQTQAQPAASSKAKRHQSSTSRVGDSDAEATVSQGSSDKENVPPLTVRPGATADNRQSARTRAGVLREQPTHSTPISQKRKAIQGELPSAGQILNGMFDFDSERSSQLESPGAARREEPLTASAQELLDYQDRGVSKVEAWKAAGHHAAHRKLEDLLTAKSGDGSIAGSWPAEEQSTGTDADAKPRMDDFDEEGFDEFGFILAERKIQDRNKHALLESFEEGDLENTNDAIVDIPTEPFNTNDDRRLAEHAFGRMSSPAIRHEGSSVAAEGVSVVRLGDHELHTARKAQTQSDAESEVEAELSTHSIKQKREKEDADTSAQRVTRSRTKRKSDVITIVEESDDPLSTVTTSALSSRKSTRQASKSKRSVSGIPLKRNETKEQKVLKVLAAESSSSPANSSASSSPRATRTRKKAADSPAAKKLAQDKLLSFLPSRKRIANTKASGSNGKKTASTTSRKGKAASTSKAKPTATKGRSKKDKSPSPKVEVIEDDNEDESDETPKRRTRASAKKGEGKNRAANDEGWRNGVNSSPIHSGDSERTKRLKEMRAAEDYSMEYELVLG